MDAWRARWLMKRIAVRERALARGTAATSGRPYSTAWKKRLAREIAWARRAAAEEAAPAATNVIEIDFAARRRLVARGAP
jgi:hypothetical protein